MSLNDLENEFSSEIKTAADELSNSLPLSKPQLRNAFTDIELKKLHEMIVAINGATGQNEKSARLANFASTALGLLKKLGVGI